MEHRSLMDFTGVDEYTRKARLQPALLVVLPFVLTLAALFPAEKAGWAVLASMVTWCGLTGLLAQVGRDQGKHKERRLFALWGGPPTTRMLRHSDTAGNPIVRARYHQKLKKLVPKVRIPSSQEEASDPEAANRVYEACVRYLRDATRDAGRFPLVFQENMNYGFRRNLWGMRPVGIALSTLGSVGCGYLVADGWFTNGAVPHLPAVFVGIIVMLLAWWLLRIRPAWVRIAAEAYAERLLEACDRL